MTKEVQIPDGSDRLFRYRDMMTGNGKDYRRSRERSERRRRPVTEHRQSQPPVLAGVARIVGEIK